MTIDIVNTLTSNLEPGDHPYLQGAWTPLLEEVNATDLKILEGAIPLDIDGVYLRNTENPVLQAKGKYHPFDGDGMLHMAAFKNGQVSYRNRFVQTKGLQAELEAGRALWAGLMEDPAMSERAGWGAHGSLKDSSSTDVVVHAGRALTTFYQCGEGYRVDPLSLEHEGIPPWSPLDGISAHCKVDESNGELLFFNYSKHAPYMHYGVVDRSGKLAHYVPIPLPGPRLPHDMMFTENWSILCDFPLFWDEELLKRDVHVTRLHEGLPSRFALIPRYGQPEDIRWFEADPTFVLHFINAYEEGDEVILDGYFEEDPYPPPIENADGYGHMMAYVDEHSFKPKLHRWRFNLKDGTTREERLDDRILEFGMMNQRYLGLPYRYAYSTTAKPGWFLFTGFVKHDLVTGESWEVQLPDGRYASEAPFAPRVGAVDEDDGYLVSFVTDEKLGTSECILIDCKRFEEGPVCRIALPHKISSGTHAHWADRTVL